jgi:hypothetical protein
MRILRELADVAHIADPLLRDLIERRILEVSDGGPWDSTLYGYFIVAEPGDSVAVLEAKSGCCMLTGRFTEANFGEPGFVPSFEFIEEHANCYEGVWILSDDGFGVVILVPKVDGIDPGLMSMCATYAIRPCTAAGEPGSADTA